MAATASRSRGHSLGGYVALLAATRSDRIRAVLAVDVKSDWTDADAELAERSRNALQRVEPERDALVDRLGRSLQPVILARDEPELLAARSIEPVGNGWRFRWDRRVLDTEPVDPFAFLSDVSCTVRVMAGSESDIMSPHSAERFATAIPGGVVELVDGVGPPYDSPRWWLGEYQGLAGLDQGMAALTIQARPALGAGDTGVFFAHTLTENSAPVRRD